MKNTAFVTLCLVAFSVPAFAEPPGPNGPPSSPAPATGERPKAKAPTVLAHPVPVAPAAGLPKGALPSGPDVVTVRFDLYRVRGDVSGAMTITGRGTWGTSQGKPKKGNAEATSGTTVVFEGLTMTIDGVKFVADEEGWKWDGKDQPSPHGRIQRIASPSLAVRMPETFQVYVGSETPIQYFAGRPDGLFELRSLAAKTGISLSGRVEKGESGTIILPNLTLTSSLVGKRMPLEGVSLDVGEPIVTTDVLQTAISLMPGRDCGIVLTSKGVGCFLIRLRVEKTEAK